MTIDDPRPATRPSDAELAAAAQTLEALAVDPAAFFGDDPALKHVRAAANRLIAALQAESERRRAERSQNDRTTAKRSQRAHDRALIERTAIRAARRSSTTETPATEPSSLIKSRGCYICKRPFRELHPHYDALCPDCAALNAAKREQTRDLRGKTALLTGGRIKIGFHIGRLLLRAGARVIVTTRFPADAARRYAAFPEHADRLQIYGLDLRDLRAVERFTDRLSTELPGLDILINNAAQTVRRPPAFYRHLLEGEGQLSRSPADLTQVPLLPEDHLAARSLFPEGALDLHGQQLDLRDRNSWKLQLGEISTVEVLETHSVNAIAPFVLINRLLPLIERTPGPRYIVNVSAMEGKFDYTNKQSAHPHTNMAKASLNMLTRTSAASLAERGIYMNSVDTGWITDENPWPQAEAMKTEGFAPPLDELDGAARVLDPIFRAGDPLYGRFLKDYAAVTW